MRAQEAWQQLVEAMETHEPACLDISLFTEDDLTKADVAACAAVCGPCPLLPECTAYAEAGKPQAGVWAGKTYGRKTRNVLRRS